MLSKAVSDELKHFIILLMQDHMFQDFNLGGGTNLALKYNHRESTDVDLFSTKKVDVKYFKVLENHVLKKYKSFNPIIDIKNSSDQEYVWMKIKTNVTTIDLIQNFPFDHPIYEDVDGVRLISDKDIFSLKLAAAAGRGSRKDFYDLYLLSKLHSLEEAHSNLIKWYDKYPVKEYPNIFAEIRGTRDEILRNDLSKLIDFNKANNNSSVGSKFKLAENKFVIASWFDVRKEWEKEVKALALQTGLKLEKRLAKNTYKRNMNWRM